MEKGSQQLSKSNDNSNDNNDFEVVDMGFQMYNEFIIVNADYSGSNNHKKLASASFTDYTKNAVTSLTQSILNIKDLFITSPVSINCLTNPIIFGTNNSSSQKMQFELDSLVRFTYKNHFYQIKNDLSNTFFKSDSGWGCTIRSGQMMLGKALMNINLTLLNGNPEQKYEITKENVKKIRRNIIELLFDNPLEISLILNKKHEFKTFINYIKSNSFSQYEIKYISSLKEFISEINQYYNNKNQQYTLSPFGIHNLLLLGKILYNKQPGEWFSDVNVLGIFSFIQNCIKVVQDVEIIHFKEGYICEETIFQRCFIKDENQNSSDLNCINKNNTKYTFSKKGIIFISIRLGIYSIEKNYYGGINNFFSIKHNIGFVGGKPRKAFYFIGKAKEGLIYLDPHTLHTAPANMIKLHEKLNHYEYKTFVLPLEALSPSLSVGFVFANLLEYLELIEDLKEYSTREDRIFNVRFAK